MDYGLTRIEGEISPARPAERCSYVTAGSDGDGDGDASLRTNKSFRRLTVMLPCLPSYAREGGTRMEVADGQRARGEGDKSVRVTGDS